MFVSEVNIAPFYYIDYFKLIDGNFPLNHLLDQRKESVSIFYDSISDNKWDYKYAEDKWSIKKVVRHIIDAELIFNYRALSIVRGEKKTLMGWSESEYGSQVDDKFLSKEKLIKSLLLQLDYTADLFSNFSTEDLKKVGNANKYDTEVGAIGFAIVAHEMHHRAVISDKYLSN